MAKPNFGSSWSSVPDIRATVEKARSNRQAQMRLLASFEEKIDRHRAHVASTVSELPAIHRATVVKQSVAGFRNQLRAESEDTRKAYVGEAARHRQTLLAAQTHYRSPAQMLARDTLGSERRSRITQQIASSGPAEIAALGEFAAAKKDMELAAAVCARLYEMEPSKRPFMANELADAVLGDLYREMTTAIDEIDRLALEAVTDDTNFELGRTTDPTRAVEIELMRQADGGWTGEDEVDEMEGENDDA